METSFFEKWSSVLQGVEQTTIPGEFIKKIVVKLVGKKQHTINIQTLSKQGLTASELEEVVTRKMAELNDRITSVEFVLNLEAIAEAVQPVTDDILKKL